MATPGMIAFPQHLIIHHLTPDVFALPLTINGISYLGVQMDYFPTLCNKLGVLKEDVKQLASSHDGLVIAELPNTGHPGTPPAPAPRRPPPPVVDKNDELRKRYIELCGHQRQAEQVKKLKDDLDKTSKLVEDYQAKLVEALRVLEEKQRLLHQIEHTDDDVLKIFANEFDALLTHPDIMNIDIQPKTQRLLIRTKLIHITDKGNTYAIGEFLITLFGSGKHGCVTMENKTNRIGTTDHPHITGGVPCLGNVKEIVTNLIGENKYSAAINICFQFLKSCNDSGHYMPVSSWPRVSRKL